MPPQPASASSASTDPLSAVKRRLPRPTETQLSALQDSWHPPPALAQAPPRRTRYSRSGYRTLALAFAGITLLAAAGVYTALVLAQTRAANEALRRDGVTTLAAVTDKPSRTLRRGPAIIWYAFRVDGASQGDYTRVTPSYYRMVKVGDSVRIAYDPAVPTRSVLVTGERDYSPLYMLLLLLPIAVLAILPMRAEAERKLLTHGLVAPALVIDSWSGGARTIKGVNREWMEYAYLTPSGAMVIARASVSTPMSPSDVITVLYEPSTPRKSRPYSGQFAEIVEGVHN